MTKQEADVIMDNYFLLQSQLSKLEKQEERAEFIKNNEQVFSDAFNVIKLLIESDNNYYQVNFQPQSQASNKNWLSAEALFRMNYSEKRIFPDAVFALANYFNYEEELTVRVFELVCKSTKTIKNNSNNNFYLSYNINPSLISADFCKKLACVMNDAGLKPCDIAIELLEVSALNKEQIEIVNKLRDRGFKILIDDFGTGYATEETLKETPFDTLKFSAQLIAGIDKPENASNRERVAKAIEFCKANGKETIAEHVETQAEFDVLTSLGIDKVQGWLISKDLPTQQFVTELGKQSGIEASMQ